jgi:signal transduction histidine kinase
MDFKDEKQLLLLIRYGLFILMISFSIIVTTFLYYKNKSDFNEIKKITEEKFIANKKQKIKDEVNNIYNYIISEQTDTELQLKETLKSRVYEVHTIITDIYKQYKDIYSKEEIRILIKTAIKDIRFNDGRGYFFIYDKTGKNIVHSLLPELEGKNLINHQDLEDNFVLKQRLELLKNSDESYQVWNWRKSKTDINEYKKIGFIKNIYELDWLVGTGEYVDEFGKIIQKRVLGQINKLRFGDNGYFFVLDNNSIYLTSIRADILGKSVIKENNLENTEEKIKEMWDKAKNGGGFIQYTQKLNPITNKPTEKIAYVKIIPKWNWLIGTGFYKDEIQKQIDEEKEILTQRYEQNIKNIFIILFVITIFLLVISFYISIIIEKKFKSYKNSIQLHLIENQKQYELLSQRTKLIAMGEMLGNIAHQWRQPLSLISTASSGIKVNKELNLLTDEILYNGLNTIEHGVKYLSETIEDFTDFFRPDREKNIFSLRLFINKLYKLVSSQLKDMNIQLVENIEDLEINGFEKDLLQVLVNIIRNSIDALEHKEGEKYIFIDIFKKEENIFIQIKDNAGGIKEDIIGRIFEPYFTTKHKSQGTGIGLYMSDEIITKHMNGKLEVENSTFEYNNKTFTGALFTIKI